MGREYVLFGAGGHARVVADAARLAGHTLVKVLVDQITPGLHFAGLPVEPLSALAELPGVAIHVAIGNCSVRLAQSLALAGQGHPLLTVLHPRSCIAADVLIGAGSLIAAGAIVAPGCELGVAAIVNHGAQVDHDCVIGAGTHIGPGVLLGGHVRIGMRTWLGIGSVLRDRLVVGDDVYLGAGSLLLKDLPTGQLAYGTPAKVVRALGSES